MKNLHKIAGALLFALLAALASPAGAAVDNTVCSASDTGGTSCTGAQLKANANEEIGALSKRAPFVVTVSGTNTITGCPSPAITAYVDGMVAQIKPAANNTGAVTVNWCSIGAVDAVSASGAALGADDLQSSTIYQFRYYAANNQWRALGTLGTGTATASAPYVTATASAGLSSERVLTAGTAIGLTDGGANTTLTVAVNDPELTCVAALTSAADKVAYYTGAGTCAVADLSSYARTIIDDANAAAARTTLGLVIGTDVQAYDADLAALAGLTSAADKGIQFTGAGTAATYDLTTAGKALLDDADATAQRATLGLVIGTNVQAFDADLSTWAGLTPSANAQSLVTAADYAAMRTLLSLVVGTNVQAFDADLSTWATLTPSANAQSLVTAANYAAMRGLLDLEAGTDFYSMAAADSAFLSASEIDTSSELRAILSDETGTGALMFGLNSAMADDLTCTGGHFLRRNAGDTAWECAAISGGGDALTSNPLSQFAATTSAQLAGVLSDESGSGAAVFATSPALTTPNLGTPSAVTLTNGTGLPISTGVSGLGTGVATALATPSSSNLRSAATDEIGTGALMFGLASTMSDDLSCTGSQVVRRNAGDTAFECATVSGTGDMVAANNLSDVANAATAFSNIKQAASETATGVVELATTSEATTGTDTTRAVTAAGVKAAIDANPSGMTLLATSTTTSGTTYSVTSIPSTCRSLYIEVQDVSFTGFATLRLAVSNTNGSAYGTAANISNNVNDTTILRGTVEVKGIRINRSSSIRTPVLYQIAEGTGNYTVPVISNATADSATENPIDAVQYSVSANAFDAGTIRTYCTR